jgi:hypothetical protein
MRQQQEEPRKKLKLDGQTKSGGGMKADGAGEPSAKEMYEMVAQAAYYRAEKRGFQPGFESDDWAQAEAEVKQRLRSGDGR